MDLKPCGHPDTEANTYEAPKTGKRGCRRCRTLAVRRCRKGPEVDPADRRLVYFIGDGELVKIGSAMDPEARLRDLQIGNPRPLVLLRTEPGGYGRECQLHRQHAEHRIAGEWFRQEAVMTCNDQPPAATR